MATARFFACRSCIGEVKLMPAIAAKAELEMFTLRNPETIEHIPE
jgi:hypothetical protein